MISVIPLLMLLLIMLFLFYLVFNKEIVSPTFICTAMYSLSLFLMLLYSKKWDVNLSGATYFAILVALVAMAMGESAGTKVRISGRRKKSRLFIDYYQENQITDGIIVSKSILILGFLFSVITAFLYYRGIQGIAANSTYAQSAYGQAYSFLMRVRWAKTLESAQVPYYIQQMYTCSGAIAAVFMYVVIFNKVYLKHKKEDLLIYLTIATYIATSIMTTGRAPMLNFFVYIIFVWLILLAKKRDWHFNNNIKLVAKVVMIITAALVLFYLAGMLTEKSFHYANFFDNFANYFSSSVYALNEYLSNPSAFGDESNFFGIHTFSGIYSFLRTLGFSIPKSIVALEYIHCGDYITNIYTPLRRYLQDFGWAGMAFIMFFIGYGYKRLVWSNKSAQSCGLNVIFAAHFMFPLVFIAIEERVFMDVIMIRSIYQIFYIMLIYHIVVNRKLFTKKVSL